MSILIFRKKRRGTPAAPVATHLTVTTQPVGSTSPNLATQPVVAAQKNDTTTDTSYVTTVVPTLNVLTGSATLGGTEATGKACVAGVCSFTNLTVTAAAGATWTLTFTSGTLASATSATATTTGGVTTYLSDAFSTTKAALTGTTADTGQTYTTVGLFTTDSVNAICSVANARATVDAGHSDGVVRWTVAQASNGWGGIFRFLAATDYWYLGISVGTPNRVFVAKFQASVTTNFLTNIVNIADGDVVSVTLSGSNITLRNETQSLVGAVPTSDAFNATVTVIGLKTDSALTGTVKWDNFSMKSA